MTFMSILQALNTELKKANALLVLCSAGLAVVPVSEDVPNPREAAYNAIKELIEGVRIAVESGQGVKALRSSLDEALTTFASTVDEAGKKIARGKGKCKTKEDIEALVVEWREDFAPISRAYTPSPNSINSILTPS
jgi:hypothetical protein